MPEEANTPKLTGVWKSIKETAVDLATIDVTSFQGDLQVQLDPDEPFDLKELSKTVKAKIKESNNTLTLAAHTHVDFDLDTVMITKPDASSSVLEAHTKAVKAAAEARAEFIRLVKDIVT